MAAIAKKGDAPQKPAEAKLWITVENNPAAAKVIKVKVGDRFEAGGHGFSVTEIRVEKRDTSEARQRGGGRSVIGLSAQSKGASE